MAVDSVDDPVRVRAVGRLEPCAGKLACTVLRGEHAGNGVLLPDEKAIAHPVDSRLLEIARHKVVSAAKRAGIQLKQTFAKEGKELRRRAGGYAHAKQFRRLKRVLKRQRTILGIVMRQVQRKRQGPEFAPQHPTAASNLGLWLERAERIRTQQRHDKNKLYALHAPEVECIGKGKARKPYEFGVKSALVVSHKQGLMLGARTFPGNPY